METSQGTPSTGTPVSTPSVFTSFADIPVTPTQVMKFSGGGADPTDMSSVNKVDQTETPKAKELAKEVLKKKQEKDDKADPEKKVGKKDEKETDDEIEIDPTTKDSKPLDPTDKSVKLYKVKQGDETLKIQSDATFKVKVRGKSEVVNLHDLLSNYSGRVDWGKQYTDLNTSRQQITAEKQDFEQSINQLYDLAIVKGDPRTAIYHLVESMGGNPHQFWDKMVANINAETQETSGLTPEQREALRYKQELEWLKGRDQEARQRTSQQAETEKTAKAIETKVQTVLSQTGMDKGTFADLYAELRDKHQLDLKDLTPESVGEYYQAIKAQESVGNLLKDVAPDMDQKSLSKAADELLDVWAGNAKLTVEDLREIAVEVYGNKAAKSLAKKIAKSKPSKVGADPVANPRQASISWDDI